MVTGYWNKIGLNKSSAKNANRIDSIGIGLASPEEIRRWSERRLPNGTLVGKVEKDHTVDYESLKPIEGGLFCERIFGPVEDFYCSCDRRGEKNEKYCPNCGVEFTSSRARRTRMGYIPLAVPVAHVWYLRGRPSYIANFIGKSRSTVDKLAYGETLCESFIGKTSVNLFQHGVQQLRESKPCSVLPRPSGPSHASTTYRVDQGSSAGVVSHSELVPREEGDIYKVSNNFNPQPGQRDPSLPVAQNPNRETKHPQWRACYKRLLQTLQRFTPLWLTFAHHSPTQSGDAKAFYKASKIGLVRITRASELLQGCKALGTKNGIPFLTDPNFLSLTPLKSKLLNHDSKGSYGRSLPICKAYSQQRFADCQLSRPSAIVSTRHISAYEKLFFYSKEGVKSALHSLTIGTLSHRLEAHHFEGSLHFADKQARPYTISPANRGGAGRVLSVLNTPYKRAKGLGVARSLRHHTLLTINTVGVTTSWAGCLPSKQSTLNSSASSLGRATSPLFANLGCSSCHAKQVVTVLPSSPMALALPTFTSLGKTLLPTIKGLTGMYAMNVEMKGSRFRAKRQRVVTYSLQSYRNKAVALLKSVLFNGLNKQPQTLADLSSNQLLAVKQSKIVRSVASYSRRVRYALLKTNKPIVDPVGFVRFRGGREPLETTAPLPNFIWNSPNMACRAYEQNRFRLSSTSVQLYKTRNSFTSAVKGGSIKPIGYMSGASKVVTGVSASVDGPDASDSLFSRSCFARAMLLRGGETTAKADNRQLGVAYASLPFEKNGCQPAYLSKKYHKSHTWPLFSILIYKEWSHRFCFLEFFLWSARDQDLALPFYTPFKSGDRLARKHSLNLIKNRALLKRSANNFPFTLNSGVSTSQATTQATNSHGSNSFVYSNGPIFQGMFMSNKCKTVFKHMALPTSIRDVCDVCVANKHTGPLKWSSRLLSLFAVFDNNLRLSLPWKTLNGERLQAPSLKVWPDCSQLQVKEHRHNDTSLANRHSNSFLVNGEIVPEISAAVKEYKGGTCYVPFLLRGNGLTNMPGTGSVDEQGSASKLAATVGQHSQLGYLLVGDASHDHNRAMTQKCASANKLASRPVGSVKSKVLVDTNIVQSSAIPRAKKLYPFGVALHGKQTCEATPPKSKWSLRGSVRAGLAGAGKQPVRSNTSLMARRAANVFLWESSLSVKGASLKDVANTKIKKGHTPTFANPNPYYTPFNRVRRSFDLQLFLKGPFQNQVVSCELSLPFQTSLWSCEAWATGLLCTSGPLPTASQGLKKGGGLGNEWSQEALLCTSNENASLSHLPRANPKESSDQVVTRANANLISQALETSMPPLREVVEVEGGGLSLWERADDTQQFPRLSELLDFTGGTVLRHLLARFHLVLLSKFLRYELKSLELRVNLLLAIKTLTYSQGLLLGKLAKRRSKQIRRLKLLELFQSQKSNPEWMILSILPVLPPDLRPILRVNDDFVVASDLNRLYQTVLRRNNTIHERLDDPLPCPESGLFRQRSLQKAVDGLLENGKGGGTPLCASKRRPLVSLSQVLKGKKGLFRQHLLGKRVDYSGRSVIVVGPKLRVYECGLPKEMAIELFQPFLIHQLKVKGLATSNTSARRMIQQDDPTIWHLVKRLVYEHPVLLNRAPTLHRLGIQAFQPRLVSGRAILLHPLVCNGFNADFDGDQMAVHVPLSFQSRAEAWKIMWARNNLLSPATGQPILVPSQDMVLGCYYLSVLLPIPSRLPGRGTREEAVAKCLPNTPGPSLSLLDASQDSQLAARGLDCSGFSSLRSNNALTTAKAVVNNFHHLTFQGRLPSKSDLSHMGMAHTPPEGRGTTWHPDHISLPAPYQLRRTNLDKTPDLIGGDSWPWVAVHKSGLGRAKEPVGLLSKGRRGVGLSIEPNLSSPGPFNPLRSLLLPTIPPSKIGGNRPLEGRVDSHETTRGCFVQSSNQGWKMRALAKRGKSARKTNQSVASKALVGLETKLAQAKACNYFTNLQDSLVAYSQGRLEAHTPFWMRVDSPLETSKAATPAALLDPLFKHKGVSQHVSRLVADKRVNGNHGTVLGGDSNFNTLPYPLVAPKGEPTGKLEVFNNAPKFEHFQLQHSSAQKLCEAVFHESHERIRVEANDALEDPLELRIGADGNIVRISTTFQHHYSCNRTFLDQCKEKSIRYVRTTVGRVVLNDSIFNLHALNG